MKLGITQEAVADALGRPQSYVSKYESGERRLDFVETLDICGALGHEAAWLVVLAELLD
jgi:transcriptional regulator with XRE-family HTH domain